MCTNEKENPLGRLYVIMRVDVNMCMSDHLRVHRNAKMETSVKIDTGTEVTAITKETHQHLEEVPLHTPDRMLYGPSTQPLKVLGSFQGKFAHKGRMSEQTTYVIDKPPGTSYHHSSSPHAFTKCRRKRTSPNSSPKCSRD